MYSIGWGGGEGGAEWRRLGRGEGWGREGWGGEGSSSGGNLQKDLQPEGYLVHNLEFTEQLHVYIAKTQEKYNPN